VKNRICILLLALSSTLGASNAGASDSSPPTPTPALASQTAAAVDLSAWLKTAMQGDTVPAMGALLIRHGRVTELAVNGIRAKGSNEAVQVDDVWHLGSNGKAMTATMVARLVERGLLAWDTPLSRLLPELAADMLPAYRDVTLIDLLTHQSGLQPNIDESWVKKFQQDKRPLHEQRLHFARLALSQAAAHARATTDLYSNNGFVIAGLVAERASGQSYETLMQREVFAPLELRSAGFGATQRGQPLGHKGGVAVDGIEADNPAVIAPAGTIHMSLGDWSKFAIDQMSGEHGRGKLLKAETYQLLHRSAREGGKFAPGWRVQNSMAGVSARHLAHTGSNDAWFALIAMRPDSEDAVLVTCNASEDVKADKVVREVATRVLKAALP
jgi:CubicO group peptidase (beta-lactamase class C family)